MNVELERYFGDSDIFEAQSISIKVGLRAILSLCMLSPLPEEAMKLL